MAERSRFLIEKIVRAGRLRVVTALTACAVVMSDAATYVLGELVFVNLDYNMRSALMMATLIPAVVAPPICLLVVDLLIINDEKSQLLERAASVDHLTGAYNRRHFQEAFRAWAHAAGDDPQIVSAILIDIDRFKSINDRWGHAVGDQVIIEVARRCAALLREGDVFARHGGEEFAVFLPSACKNLAAAVAERMRRAVEAAEIVVEGASIPVTISLGVVTATLAPTARRLDSLLRVADDRLYSAKASGRNRVAAAEAA
jgi:diguanylate cyclase (GGDEF)-like protein